MMHPCLPIHEEPTQTVFPSRQAKDDSVCMQPRTIACAYKRQDDRTSVDRRRVPKGDSRVDTPDPNPNTHFL